MAKILRCPACRKKFKWFVEEGFPEECPICEKWIGHGRADDDVVMPFVRTNAKMKAVDDVYRQMEAGSIHRSQLAAGMLGVPSSEMSDLKITNLHDNQRPGDVAAVVPNSPVSELMKQFPQQTGFVNHGLGYSAGTQQGPLPNRGAKLRSALQREHAAAGNVTSDVSANETYQPGYRRRG